jgi:hypothetical protein
MKFFNTKYRRRHDAVISLDEDVLSSQFECSLGALSFSSKCDELFLNRFRQNTVNQLLESSGMMSALAQKGFPAIIADFSKDGTGMHRLLLYADSAKKTNILAEIRLSEQPPVQLSSVTPVPAGKKQVHLLQLEWICLENPTARLIKDRPLLPGQRRPGLGILSQALAFLTMLVDETGCDGLAITADHFHAAAMYSSHACFSDPHEEGILRAVLRDLAAYSLNDISWGFTTEAIKNKKTGETATFRPALQLLPVSKTIRRFFESRRYRVPRDRNYRSSGFSMDYEQMKRKRAAILKNRSASEL